jgi:hypothetical protein
MCQSKPTVRLQTILPPVDFHIVSEGHGGHGGYGGYGGHGGHGGHGGQGGQGGQDELLRRVQVTFKLKSRRLEG